MTVPPDRGAPAYPEGLSELVSRVDLNHLVERYAGTGRRSGRTITYSCPNPGHADQHPSFTVTTTAKGKQLARCWSLCGWQGDALELVKWLENLTTGEAAERLRDLSGAPRPMPKPARTTVPTGEKCVSNTPKDSARRPQPARAERFLERYLDFRGWPSSVVDKFGLEVVLDSGGACRVRHPFFTPVSEGKWAATYWQDRGTGTGPKWLSPKGAAPQLYNLSSLERDGLLGVVLCEGPADTVTAALALEGAEKVAVVGCPGVNAWRNEWAALFAGLRVVVAADPDNAGQLLEEKVTHALGRRVTCLRLSSGDLTETAKTRGLEKLRELLVVALGLEPDTPARSLEETVALLLRMFPGGRLEVTSHE
jgi:DNA primase